MWIHQNRVDHAVDEQGLPFCLSQDIEAAIHKEFHKGTEGLSQCKLHFIHQDQDNVMSLLAADKQDYPPPPNSPTTATIDGRFLLYCR
jgi:hypothetical protein